MGHLNHFSYGLLTPAFGYLVMTMAAAIGLRCTVRALDTQGGSRRNWLLVGSTAIGAGIWTLHFIAMLGFGVIGSSVRYNVPITLLSLVLAILVVGMGVFIVGYGRSRTLSLILGGLGMGLGVATMHYSGMAAVQVNGTIQYNSGLVLLSVLIAITAATAALWLVLNIQGLSGALGAALVMGLAVSTMHYTAMAAVGVELSTGVEELTGATAMQFIFPLSVGIGAILFVAFTVVAVSPIEEERGEAEVAMRLQALQARREQFAQQIEDQITASERHPSPRRRQPSSNKRPTRQIT
ncbi:MAG TPA: MHYT domain-containing protein [Jiangellaceae bacterium]|nr:MHYT domain-containing protein [Jiangellaceae bacterium]